MVHWMDGAFPQTLLTATLNEGDVNEIFKQVKTNHSCDRCY